MPMHPALLGHQPSWLACSTYMAAGVEETIAAIAAHLLGDLVCLHSPMQYRYNPRCVGPLQEDVCNSSTQSLYMP